MFEKERDFAGNQIQGGRDYQEDAQAFGSLRKGPDDKVEILLTVLTDGMGGANAGDFASETVLREVVGYCAEFNFEDGIDEAPKVLDFAMKAANQAMAKAIDKDESLDGMGCTLLATLMTKDKLYWLSVGDSPLYLYRKGKMEQINEDHSMVPLIKQLIDEGKLKPEAVFTHPHRNALRSVMGGCEVDLIDCPRKALQLRPGDIVVVASDGIQSLSENSICSVIEKNYHLDAAAISEKLITAVEDVKRPRQDNTSVNVIRLPIREK